MVWSAEPTRRAIRRVMETRGLSVNGWTKRAGMRESTLRNFLNGASQSLTQRTLEQLASAENLPVAALTDPNHPIAGLPTLGEEPPAFGPTLNDDEQLIRDCIIAIEELIEERGESRSAEEKADIIVQLWREERQRATNGRGRVPAAEVIRLVRRPA